MLNIIVPWLNKIEVLINRIYYLEQIKNILVWDWEVQTENYNNDFILTDERIDRYYINHTTSIRHQKVHLTYIQNRPALARYLETKGNYKHQE